MPRKKAAAEPSPAAIDLAALRALAGPIYWQRGEAYFRGRRVDLPSFDDSRASAIVRGSDRYRVELRFDRVAAGADAWRCACECPLGEDDEVCKHIVATALSWQTALAAFHARACTAAKVDGRGRAGRLWRAASQTLAGTAAGAEGQRFSGSWRAGSAPPPDGSVVRAAGRWRPTCIRRIAISILPKPVSVDPRTPRACR